MDNSVLLAAQELQRWNATVPITSIDQNYCQQLYETLSRNYPCMKAGICTPFNMWWTLSIMIFVLCLFLFGGYYLGAREERKEQEIRDRCSGKKS